MKSPRVVVVTGGASGIGRAACLKFARAGARVVIADVDESGGAETARLAVQAGEGALFLRTDVAVYAEVEALIDAAVAAYGRIDVMFNNAGISREGPFLDLDLDKYHQVVAVNQHGVVYGIRAAARKMRELRIQGVIINTASVLGYLASRGSFGYHAAKGAVVMITKSAALELAELGIRVVGVAPGAVDTPILKAVHDAGLTEQVKALHMRRRLLTPEAVADAVYLLSLPEADVINGSVVMLDDGFGAFKI